MIKVAISFSILGIAILLISTGLLILTEAQLDRRPENPVSLLLIAEKRNLGQTKQVSQAGLMIGAVMVVLSAAASALLYWRDR
tara:strand:+ start:876 stop:1124 length:249 start_codon:yes stop_codon:yes gene_type:complete